MWGPSSGHHESRRDKRREVNWTLTKKLDTFAGSGEVKDRKVVLNPQGSSEEIRNTPNREVELGLKVGLLLHQLFLTHGSHVVPWPSQYLVCDCCLYYASANHLVLNSKTVNIDQSPFSRPSLSLVSNYLHQ